MEFVSVRATAERWGVSVRNVQRLLKEERIHGAYKCSGCWMIPADAPKPDDPRRERKKAREAKAADAAAPAVETETLRPRRLGYGLLSVIIPMPRRDADAVLPLLKETALRREYEMELAYLRGNYELAVRRFGETQPEEPTRFCAAMLTMLACIHINNGDLYA